ncbi:MAG: hypothetical protein Q7T82_20880 [Armatimonadota bacterium]|nr:hypothetical protein [Armatimonadota bacterium]
MHVRFWFLPVLLVLTVAAGPPSYAKALIGEAHVVVLDADTMQPLQGASIGFLKAGQSWPPSDPSTDKKPLAVTDVSGAAKGKVEIGRKGTTWKPFVGFRDYQKNTGALVVHAEKEGYKPVTADTNYVVAIGSKVCVRDVILARNESEKESVVSDQTLRPRRVILEPSYGLPAEPFNVTVEIEMPRSLANYLIEKGVKKMQVSVVSKKGCKQRRSLALVDAVKPGEVCRFTGALTAKSGLAPAVYPIDLRFAFGGAKLTQADWPDVAHIAIAETKEAAKQLYDTTIAPIEAK